MATSIKVKFRNSTIKNSEGVLYFQLIRNRKVKLIKSRFRLYSREWDAHNAKIHLENASAERLKHLQTTETELNDELLKINKLIDVMEDGNDYGIEELAEYYSSQSFNSYLFPFSEYLIKTLNGKNRIKTASIYATVRRSFIHFRSGKDILMAKIDNEMLLNYEIYLKNSGLRKNSISCYIRALRAIYNQAVKRGFTSQKQPFTNIYTGIDKTIKRAVSEETVVHLKNMDLSAYRELELARDLFMFSFYMRGMSFVDMANLRKNSIRNGYITYTRSKTKQVLTVKMEKCIKNILFRYAGQTVSDYLLPVYSRDNDRYASHLRTYNKRLIRLSGLLGLEKPLSSYVSRHSWATMAFRKGIAIEIISESMGHENLTTTRIYLASLGQSIIDQANAKVIALK